MKILIYFVLVLLVAGCSKTKDEIVFEELQQRFSAREKANVVTRVKEHEWMIGQVDWLHSWYPKSKYIPDADKLKMILSKELSATKDKIRARDEAIHREKIEKYHMDKNGAFEKLEKNSTIDRIVKSDEGKGNCSCFTDETISRELVLYEEPKVDSKIIARLKKGQPWEEVICYKELLKFGRGEYDGLPVIFWFVRYRVNAIGGLFISFDGKEVRDTNVFDKKFKVLTREKERIWTFFRFPNDVEGWAVDSYKSLNVEECPES